MSAELLTAAKKVITARNSLGLMQAINLLKSAVEREEQLMEREADWYQHQFDNAQREYHENMLRGEE